MQKSSSSRIAALDLLRGYLILVIASVHLAYYPSLIGSFDGRGQLWTSEAEGFFFISGLLIGIIRRKDIQRANLWLATKKVWQRGARLYLAGIILTLVYVLIGRALLGIAPSAVKGGLDAGSSWWNVIFQTLILRYSYGWSDFLIFYAGFLFVAPAMLWLLKRGWWYVALAATLGVWYWRWTGGYGPYNSFFQWQVYFFMGTIIGYYWNELAERFRRFGPVWRRRLKIASLALAAALFVVSATIVFGPQTSSSPWLAWIGTLNASHAYNRMLVDGRVGLLRPLALLVMFGGAFFVVRRFEVVILRWIGWLLLPFGKNSLYVYIVESMLLFAIPFIVRPSGFWINSMVEIVMVGLVWLAVRHRVLFRVIPR